jgi:CubicO group peptidase (beta-lactamase class C family)
MFSRFSAVLLAAASCLAQNGGRMDEIVKSFVADHQFMGSVLVARGNEVLFSQGYGYANLEWDIPNAPNTKFRLGSITKQFTAASILLLEERGKLSVASPVKKYLPDAPAAWDQITVFHLLTHTSGIPNFTDFLDYRKREPFATTSEQLIARFQDRPLEFEPGQKWKYSNSGYVVLTRLIEKITGDSYEKFIQENIFTPLGMKDSGYDSNSAVIAHRAAGYVRAKDAFENAGFIHMSVPQGAGALYSTTQDLWKWTQGLFGGKLLSPASLDKMTTPFKNDYAFGLVVRSANGHKEIGHGGGIEGFNTALAYYPEDKLTVVVLGNVNGPAPDQIAAKLGAVSRGETVKLASERKEIALDPNLLSRYVGAYRLTQGPALLITLENNQLFEKLGNQPAFPIYAESETGFFLKVVDAQIEFPKEAGKASQLTLHQNGRAITAKRMDNAEARKVLDADAAFAKRFKDQTAAPGSEAALRRWIEEVRTGKPSVDLMSANLVETTRQQLPQLQSMLKELGNMQSLAFTGVGPGGADIYQVNFENGSLEYRILLGEDGKIEGANVRPQ